MNTLFSLIASLIFAGGSLLGIHSPEANLIGGDFNPTGGGTYRIQSSITSTQSTITLTSFKEPVSGIKYTMAYLNSSIEYGTIEPQSSNKEFVSFTGITQNSDGTATLTGVTRGLGFSFPYTASSTLQVPHSGQSIFILSNPPQLTNQYANKNNSESISGLWSFSSAPIDNGTSTSTLQFATRAYVNSIATQGAATSTIQTGGIGIMATGAQAAAGTYPSLLSPYFLSTLISSSTYTGYGSNKVVITGSSNTIDPNYISTSSALAPAGYSWTASTTFSGATTTLNAISIAANGVSPLYLRGVPYVFPSSQSASSTVPFSDGTGKINFYQPQWELLGDNTLASNNATSTVTFSGTHRMLMIVADIAGTANNTALFLSFNNDYAGNYSTQFTQATNSTLNTYITDVGATSTRLMSTPGSTFGYGLYTIFVNNNASRIKTGTFQGMAQNGTAAQSAVNGAFTWNNTSAAITTVSLTTGYTMQMSAGTRLQVYGSRD